MDQDPEIEDEQEAWDKEDLNGEEVLEQDLGNDEVEEEEDAGEDDVENVAEHLRDAVEGSFRLKRLLAQDDDETQATSKRRKIDSADEQICPEKEGKVQKLLGRWNLAKDIVCRHVLQHLETEELDHMIASGFVPETRSPKKTAAELVQQHCHEVREKSMGGRSSTDIVAAFRARWGLDTKVEATLRSLNHKDLRYVLDSYDGSSSVEDAIDEARMQMPEVEATSASAAAPHRAGPLIMSRFNRLELIDPMADCAVFGDANLTFAKNLARHRKDLGHAGRVIATTFEDIDTLRERYREIDQSIKELEDCDAEVYHNVDCTRIAVDDRFHGMEHRLGAVYYNFPHSGSVSGFFDSNPMVNWRHENLMRLFFRALRTFVKPGGVVKVASNNQATGVRFSFIVGGAAENEFVHVETVPFLEWHMHRYGRSYGDKRDAYRRPDATNNQSYNAQKAQADMVYCFCYKPTGRDIGRQRIRMPPSVKTLSACTDGPFRSLPLQAKSMLAKKLYERFRKEVSGTHVG